MSQPVIGPCSASDFETIHRIINDGAAAYVGKVPADCLHQPYMASGDLRSEIAAGVQFWGCRVHEELQAVMGLQHVGDVSLIRHAYTASTHQRLGLGHLLLAHLQTITRSPILIGTWRDATWAIRFYEKHGFRVVPEHEKVVLLRKYWSVSERQVEMSVVLADSSFPPLGAL